MAWKKIQWSDDTAAVTVRKNSGANIGTRPRLNFIEGSNITLAISDDAGGDEIDISIAASGGGVTDHGALTGLVDDDHTQYLLVNGTRAMTGNLGIGTHKIIRGTEYIDFGDTNYINYHAASDHRFFADIIPGTDETWMLGISMQKWAEVWAKKLRATQWIGMSNQTSAPTALAGAMYYLNGHFYGVNASGEIAFEDLTIFEENTNVIREKSAGGYDNDFIIGSPQLDDDGNTAHDYRMFFDKSKGAFRSGETTGTQWNDANVGAQSYATGSNTTASETASYAEGYDTEASAGKSHAGGSSSHAHLYTQFARSSGKFTTRGDAQFSNFVVMRETTDATQTELTLGGYAPGSVSRCFLPASRTWAFSSLIAARQTAGSGTVGDSGIYKIEGGIKRDGANITALIGSITKTVLAEDQASWDVTAEADNINECLVIKVTGEASKTIHWGATVNLTEVG